MWAGKTHANKEKGREEEKKKHNPVNRMMVAQYFPVRGTISGTKSPFSISVCSHAEIHLRPLALSCINIFQNTHGLMHPALYFCLIAHVLSHLLSEEESQPSFSYPPSEWMWGHSSLKSRLSLAIFLSLPSSHGAAPLFISSSLPCNIISSLFFLLFSCFILRGFCMFFNILSVLALLQHSLSSPPLQNCVTYSSRAHDHWHPLPAPADTSFFSSHLSLCSFPLPFCFCVCHRAMCAAAASDTVFYRWCRQALCLSELCIGIT